MFSGRMAGRHGGGALSGPSHDRHHDVRPRRDAKTEAHAPFRSTRSSGSHRGIHSVHSVGLPAPKHAILREPETAVSYLRLLAISRLVLDNFDNIQASWVTMGPKVAQLALFFGANDFGSTMIEENVVAAAGVTSASPKQNRHLITSAGYKAQRQESSLPNGGDGEGRGARVQDPYPLARTPNPPPANQNFGTAGFQPVQHGQDACAPDQRESAREPEGRAKECRSLGPPPKSPGSPSSPGGGAPRIFWGGVCGIWEAGRRPHPFGESDPVHLFEHEGLTFAVLSRHGEEGYHVGAAF